MPSTRYRSTYLWVISMIASLQHPMQADPKNRRNLLKHKDNSPRLFLLLTSTMLLVHQPRVEGHFDGLTLSGDTPSLPSNPTATQSQQTDGLTGSASRSSLGTVPQALPHGLDFNGNCICMACLQLGYLWRSRDPVQCRYPECDHASSDSPDGRFKTCSDRAKHELGHFKESGGYRCLVLNCTYKLDALNHGRDGNLLRGHYCAKHCQSSPRYPCPEPGCHHQGDNAFKRPGYLKKHLAKVHDNKRRKSKNGSDEKQKFDLDEDDKAIKAADPNPQK